MRVSWGVDSAALKRGERREVVWNSKTAVNGHTLMVGMSGAGKTHNLRNLIRQMSETCEDGNTTSGDGCSATCQLEPGWTCPLAGAGCSATACGDGLVAGAEACDDDNTTPGDGCSATCQLEAGHHCPVPGAACATPAASEDASTPGVTLRSSVVSPTRPATPWLLV